DFAGVGPALHGARRNVVGAGHGLSAVSRDGFGHRCHVGLGDRGCWLAGLDHRSDGKLEDRRQRGRRRDESASLQSISRKQPGLGYVLWQALFQVAVVTTWQTTIARVLSAKDEKTAKKIYRRSAFYFVGRFALPGLWGVAALVHFNYGRDLPASL